MVHTFDRDSRTGSGQSKIHQDSVQWKTSTCYSQQPEVKGVLSRIRLIGTGIGRADGNHVLGGMLAYRVSVIAQQLPVGGALPLARGIERIQSNLVLLPIFDRIPVRIDV